MDRDKLQKGVETIKNTTNNIVNFDNVFQICNKFEESVYFNVIKNLLNTHYPKVNLNKKLFKIA